MMQMQSGPGSSRSTGGSKSHGRSHGSREHGSRDHGSREPMFTDAAGGRLSERMGAF